MTSTFAYFQQQDIVSLSINERGAQTAFLASIDVGVNALALLVQLFLTGRVVAILGVSLALALLPALTMVGFAGLALAPSLAMVAVFQVIRRATDYAITRPVREVIYTVVSREDRYKAKGFIDTFVYRAGRSGRRLVRPPPDGHEPVGRPSGRDRDRGGLARQRALARPAPAGARGREGGIG